MDKEQKALYGLLQVMGDTAADAYWGDAPEVDAAWFTDKAYNMACAEIVHKTINDYRVAEWYSELFDSLIERFGHYLETMVSLKRLGIVNKYGVFGGGAK